MKLHKFCRIFPPITGEEFANLVADIRANGLQHPITTYKDQILDGQNRFNACEQAGVKPLFQEFTGDDPLGFVISRNLNRRHLTDDQRAAIAAEITTYKGRQVAESATLRNADAAQALKVSTRQVRKAKQVKNESPAAFKAVKEGKKTLNEAHEEKHPRKRKPAPVAPPDPDPVTDADIVAATDIQPPPSPAEVPEAPPRDRHVEQYRNVPPEPDPASAIPISTVQDALAFCRSTDEPGHNWEAAATILAAEVERLTADLAKAAANIDILTAAGPDTSPLTPAKLLAELKKFKPRIPDTLPQAQRAAFGEQINKMVIWLMNPVTSAETPSAYTR